MQDRVEVSDGMPARAIRRLIAALVVLILVAAPSAHGQVTLVATDVAAEAGLAQRTMTYGSYAFDHNADGLTDLLLHRHGAVAPVIYQNTNGAFLPVSVAAFRRVDRHGCAFADVNRDGRVDAYCSLGTNNSTLAKKNELWISQTNGTFIDRATEYGVTDPNGRGRAVAFVDGNRDGYPDLYVGNWTPQIDGTPGMNRFFINEGGTRFRSAPEFGLDNAYGTTCAQTADFNRDGHQDLLVCTRSQGIAMFRNDGTSFSNQRLGLKMSGKFFEDAHLADLDGNGSLDVIQLRSDYVQIQLKNGPNTMYTAPRQLAALSTGHDIGVGDVNADGRPDIYVVQKGAVENANDPDLFFLNSGNGVDFVQVDLPQATGGAGDTATPIDYDNDGRMEFVVTNGADVEERGATGPVQLIRFD